MLIQCKAYCVSYLRLDYLVREWQLDIRFALISLGTDALNQKPSGFPVKITSASVGSVVAVVILVTFVFLYEKVLV